MTSSIPQFARVAGYRDVRAFRARLQELGLVLPCDDTPLAAPTSPLAQAIDLPTGGRPLRAPNRFVIQPMEGWDGTPDGRPSDLTFRRWRNFGRSGAGWMWGGEAVAVRFDGRANPRQLVMTDASAADIGRLRVALLEAAPPGTTPVAGLQLTHSGRWSRSIGAHPDPRVAFRHPLLDRRVASDGDVAVLTDDDVRVLIGDFARAAYLAQEEGFDFVDVKHCHGYLLHEFLAARKRTGAFGGVSLPARTRLATEVIEAVRTAAPRLAVGVRLSAFDCVPHCPAFIDDQGHRGPGVAEAHPAPYPYGFGIDCDHPEQMDLDEPIAFVRLLQRSGVLWLNVTGGSPYYSPHVQRPALFPPSDGYAPPEDPLVGVARQLQVARTIKLAVPEMIVVSSGWSYLQEYIAPVAQACLREEWFDAIGLGRMVLAYPELPRDVLAGRPLDRRRICRTFSDCTSAPRNGLVSGCYPLDPFYRALPERAQLEAAKRGHDHAH